MKKAFDVLVKPAYSRMNDLLGVKQIEVNQFSMAYEIPVRVPVIGANGDTILVKNTKLFAANLLGLSIRSVYEEDR